MQLEKKLVPLVDGWCVVRRVDSSPETLVWLMNGSLRQTVVEVAWVEMSPTMHCNSLFFSYTRTERCVLPSARSGEGDSVSGAPYTLPSVVCLFNFLLPSM